MDTYFAPAVRTEPGLLGSQLMSISNSPVMNAILQTAAGMLIIINENRQIVAFNHSFLEKLGISDPGNVLGLRLGEALHCKYASLEPDGCGTTPYCSSCGAAIAMMAAIDDNKVCERMCALKVEANGRSSDICLLVRAHPLTVDGKRWILIYVQDITQQQFWANLENVFFHDLNNMICAMRSYSKYLHDLLPVNPYSFRQKMLADRMFQEVKMQGELSSVRSTEGLVNATSTTLQDIRNEVFDVVLVGNAIDGKMISEECAADKFAFKADTVLISKVLINMLLNALEATDPGGKVIFRTFAKGSRVEWQIWNEAVIPDDTQLRIFQRYFSTKPGYGHGLGTYSMKFFGEECLGGKVSFTSARETGTTFRFSLAVERL